MFWHELLECDQEACLEGDGALDDSESAIYETGIARGKRR